MANINEKFERKKKQLKEDINKVKEDVLPTLKKKREDIMKEKEKYVRKIKQISKNMEEEYHSRLKDLEKIYDDRMKDLFAVRDADVERFDRYSNEIFKSITSWEEKIVKSEDAIKRNNMESMAKIKMTLCDIESTRKLPDLPSFEHGNNLYIGVILGKLHVPSPSSVTGARRVITPTVVSQIKCPLQGLPCICITKEGDIWLGGDKSRELVMVDIKGQVLRMRKIQNRPIALAVNDCGDVIISSTFFESNSVTILRKDGREESVYDASPSFTLGVSVTILICTGDGRVVRINSDGTSVKQIYTGLCKLSALHAVEKADGNIYITDFINRAVVIVNKDGTTLSTITHTTGGQRLGLPWGLVVDKMDNVLFIDYDNDCVYIIDQKQQIRELIGQSHNMTKPKWLAVDYKNKMWITQGDGTMIVST